MKQNRFLRSLRRTPLASSSPIWAGTFAALLLVAVTPQLASADTTASLTVLSPTPVTIGFDDLTSNTGLDSITGIPDGYAGLSFVNFYTAASDAYPGSNFSAGVTSGNYAAVTGFSSVLSTISSPVPFRFLSARLTSQYDPADQVQIQGFLAGESVFSLNVPLTSTPVSPDLSTLTSANIDALTFTLLQDPDNNNFVLDDLQVAFIPEPTALAALAPLPWLLSRPRRRA